MSTQYPSQVDSFPVHVDNNNETITAGAINNIQDSVVALENNAFKKTDTVTNSMLGAKPNFGFPNLLRPSIANFVRNSVAWRRNFSQVVANQIRTEMGVMGDAPYIEESTTNIMPAGSDNFQTGWTTNGGATVTVTGGQSDPFGGSNAYHITSSGGTITSVYYASLTVTSGQSYANSVWIKVNNANPVIVGSGLGTTQTVTQSQGWVQVKLQNLVPSSTSMQLAFNNQTAGTALDFTVIYPQVENKAYCTSYIPPQQTRNADSLSYTLHAPLPNRWFGAVRWIPDQSSSQLANRDYYLMAGYTTSNSICYIVSYRQSSKQFLIAKSTDGGTTYQQSNSAVTTFNAGDIITVFFEDDPITAQSINLWVGVNGGSLTQTSFSSTSQITSCNKLYIGCNANVGAEANGTVEPLITTTIPTTEQLNWLYNAPLWGQGNFPDVFQPNTGWYSPTLLNGWVNFGGGNPNVGYMKDSNGFVRFTGLLKNTANTTGSTKMFQLPQGYRPKAGSVFFATTVNYSFGSISVTTDGSVFIDTNTTAGQWVALNNITFLAEQ